MLKDILETNFNIVRVRDDDDKIQLNLRGELDIKGYRGNELVYHDGGDNTIMLWAKHSVIHLLTGDAFSNKGADAKNRPINADHSNLSPFNNGDGMLLSGNQYWWDGSTIPEHWSRPAASPAGYNFPMFPTKLLFGTGKEFPSWASINPAEQALLTSKQGWNSGNFDTNINHADNYYSNLTTNSDKNGLYPLIKTRTVDDVYSGKLVGVPANNEWGVEGAIRDGLARNNDGNPSWFSTGTQTLVQQNRGIGKPSFIYFQRSESERWTETTSEVYLTRNASENYEHKITFTLQMPDQTAENGNTADWFYPYNGYTLKVVGLFTDARLCLRNTIPASSSDPDYYPYNNMSSGFMIAKRYIAPIVKTPDLRLSVQWSLYL